MSPRKCQNSVDTFCDICRNFMTSIQKQEITGKIRIYNAYFGFKIQPKS